ncbi:hypothetical protein ACFSWE_06795 [Leucobacter albus]|uniref:AMP-binding enzyme n=1 Tax=Leucobacter albus TaxID=272210 RepID=UPI003631AC54
MAAHRRRRHPASADEESVLAYARERLSAYKVPRRAIHFVKTLPTTSSGKLMRRALRPERQ